MSVAIITGASKGLGRALAEALAARGWDLVLDARTEGVLTEAAVAVAAYGTRVEAVPGDVTDAAHRAELVAAAGKLGGVDLVVSNASALGAEPLVRLEELALDGLKPSVRYGGSFFRKLLFSALLLNAILGFILLWIACHAYNWVASRFGGIEIQLSDVPEEA